MASPVAKNPLLAQLNSLSQLSLTRQLGFMLIVAASIALGSATVLWSTNPGYTALYTGLSDQDSADVLGALEQNGLSYRIDNGSGLITVPADQVRRIRMQLANQGLPRSTSQGFEILNQEQSLGTSNFVEQARYNRALEQELTQTIKQIHGVRDARVHLSIPRQSSFIRNSRKPSASVMIDVINLQVPGDAQLSGIVHLVASSVAGLETDQVSVVDQRGNLLSDRNNSELGNSTEAMRFTRSIEENYSERILDLLTPIVGAGNVKAQVAADIDFTAMETTEETYNPETLAIRSEQLEEETANVNGEAEAVVPGTVAPAPPTESVNGDGQSSGDQSRQTRTNTVRNYEVDRSVSHIKTTPGAIEQLSVAVLVDLSASIRGLDVAEDGTQTVSQTDQQVRIDRLTQLVKDAVGFNESRGDTVSVINEQFYSGEAPLPEALPLWQQPWFFTTLRQSGAALVVLLLIFGVLRPALKAVVTNSNGGTGNRPVAKSGSAEADDLGNEQVQLSGSSGTNQLASPGGTTTALSFDNNLARAQNLVLQEPTRAARMIQGWLANE